MEHAGTEAHARCVPGVYTIDAERRAPLIAGNVVPSNLHLAVVDGNVAANRDGFFDELSRTMRFPDYFGRNWDAVFDCLTDPSWLPAAGSVIVLDECHRFASEHPDQWRIALKVFTEACAFWRRTRIPMFVLLYGADDDAPGVPVLPVWCLAEVGKVH